MSSDLWTEKYRPKTLQDYVFKNENTKRQINEWVANPTNKKIPIPNLMMVGPPGVGKCLGPNEEIEVIIDETKLTFKQIEYLKSLNKI